MTERSRSNYPSDLNEVVQATVQGCVSLLLLEEGRLIPGRLHPDSGRVANAASHHGGRRARRDLGELVERMGCAVHALAAPQMPTNSGLSATYRH